MRANFVLALVLVLAVALGGAAFLFGGDDGNERREPPVAVTARNDAQGADPTAQDTLDTPADDGGLPVDREALPVEPAPDALNEQGNGEYSYDGPINAERIREQLESEFWRQCMGAGSLLEIRACIRASFAGPGLSPTELAALVCGDIPPDGPDRLLIEEVAATWAPTSAAGEIREFHSLCNAPGVVWADFLRLQSERAPEWVEAFARSLEPHLVFEGDDIVLLQALEQLADDDATLRDILERGARGEFGGTDQQVAFALARSLRMLGDAGDRMEFLRGVVASETFEGRLSEVDAMVRGALDERLYRASPSDVVAFLEGLFDDPRLAASAAHKILALDRDQRMPAWMDDSVRRLLVQRAHDALRAGS